MSERDIFLAAIERPESERGAYLDEACGADSGLRRRVETLLNSHDGAGSFLGKPLVSPPEPDHASTRAFTPEVDLSEPRSRSDDEAEAMAFLAPPGRADSLGRIGHYEVLQILGRGGFGIVFRAFDTVLQRVVAVKVMTPQLAATSPARKRFIREAQTSAKVRHENVVQVHEVGDQPLPFLVMEFIPGETLQQKLDRTGPLDVAETVRIGRQIAEGLAAAHATDLIHRDIKPGNVLIEGGQHRVKITDFGLARAADDASISQSGIIAGTPMYMAPEQALGHKLDQRADLFSLGSVMYQIVAGRPPFRANSTLAVLKRVAEDTPRSIREIVPETPQWLCDIIAKLHAKNPDERYQTAREVADVLADCEEQLKANSKLKDFSRIPSAKSPTRPLGRKWKWAAAALLVGVLGSIAAVWLIPPVSRYADNMAELAFDLSDPDFERAIVYSGEAVVADVDLRSSPTIRLAPGQYKLEIRAREGRGLEWWYYNRYGLKQGKSAEPLVANKTTFRLDVVRGERVEFTARLEPIDQGFTPLFDGTQLTGWKWHPKKEARGYSNTLGVMTLNGPTHMFTERAYTDFHLKIEARCAENAEPMLGVRAPFEIDGAGKVRCLATGLGLGANTVYNPWDGIASGPVENLKPGDWYTQEWIVKGDFLQVKVNGQQVLHTGGLLNTSGHVVLTIPPQKLTVRKIEIKDLAPGTPASDGFSSLFNGKDLTGWKKFPDDSSNWQVTGDGCLRGSGQVGHLFTTRDDYRNFHFRVEARINDRGNSGQYFRAIPGSPFPHGYEAQINSTHFNPAKTGSLFQYVAVNQMLVKPDEWFMQEVIAEGNHIVIKVNDKITADYVHEMPTFLQGHVALGVDDPGTIVEFRKIEIKELPPIGAQSDEQLLQGRWVPFEAESGGKKMPAEQLGRMTFTGDKVRVELQGVPNREGTFKLGTNRTPREIDVIRNEDFKGMRGIYRFDGDVLTLCADEPGPTRPTKFETGPDTGTLMLMRFRKAAVTTPVPFTDAEVKRIAALPAAEQAEEVRKELKKRNPDYAAEIEFVVENDRVARLTMKANGIRDLSPVRALPKLQYLECTSATLEDLTPLQGSSIITLSIRSTGVSDLTPLRGMRLTHIELAGCGKLTDLTGLEDMPLTGVSIAFSAIKDLAPLKGMKLTHLNCESTSVSDFAPLAGMQLTELYYKGTRVSDITVLKAMPLTQIHLDYDAKRDRDTLRGLTTLTKINDKTAEEFWKDADKK